MREAYIAAMAAVRAQGDHPQGGAGDMADGNISELLKGR
jgi:hypothetical protein